jgi:hypothetical protein
MSERLLSRIEALTHPDDPAHPVYDLERLCRVILDGHLRATATPLEPADYDEALGFLFGESYVLQPRYRPDRGSVPFAAWMQGQLAFRLRDHLRAPYGRRSEHRIGQGRFAELDRPGADGDGHPLDRALSEGSCDRGDDRGEALGGVDAPRDRQVLREVAGLGLGARRRVAPRARGSRAPRGVDQAGPWLDCPGCGWRNYPQAPNGMPGWHLEECAACGERLEREVPIAGAPSAPLAAAGREAGQATSRSSSRAAA